MNGIITVAAASFKKEGVQLNDTDWLTSIRQVAELGDIMQ